MTRKEMLIEAVLVSLCKLTVYVIYPAVYFIAMKDKTHIYKVEE